MIIECIEITETVQEAKTLLVVIEIAGYRVHFDAWYDRVYLFDHDGMLIGNEKLDAIDVQKVIDGLTKLKENLS